MSPLTQTTTTTLLLEGLFDAGNAAAWSEFHDRYVPIILGVARKLGLSEADAADVAQETLAAFLRDYRAGKYDRQRGRLRAWNIGIVKHRLADLRRAQAAQRVVRGDSALAEVVDEQELTAAWDAEHRQAIVRRALAELRASTRTGENTIIAFERFVLEQRPAADVAAELGLTPGDVYMAKNRVAERLREIVTRLEALYDDGG